MERRHLEAQVPRASSVGWLKRTGLWRPIARVTLSGLRPLIRRALVRKPGTTQMSPADRNYLREFYQDDIRKLAKLVGRNLDGWIG